VVVRKDSFAPVLTIVSIVLNSPVVPAPATMNKFEPGQPSLLVSVCSGRLSVAITYRQR
jgi:hypothetical protein